MDFEKLSFQSQLAHRAPTLLSGLLLLTFLLVTIDYIGMLLLRRRLPPGPFPFPIVGNHFQLPKSRPWIEWEQWAQYYDNPMTTIWVGRHPRIILQDAWVASDLMEKRADVWSSRPRLIVMGDLIDATDTNQTTLVYGDRWRLHRKLMHSAVGSQAVRNLRTIQANESKILIRDMLEEPKEYVLSIERYSVSTTSIIGWGRRVDRKDDYVAQQALAIMEGVNFVVPGRYLMEAVPALTHLPAWIYTLPSSIRDVTAVLQKYFYMLSQEGADSKLNNFSKVLLNGQETYGLTDVEVAGLTANLIGGGVDTTSSTMISCILAMAAFPDVQKKAQSEIDSVVGEGASPGWEDIDGKLPYCTALVKEVLRWRTVTILAGIPHANTVDFEYRGYHFPAGTNITGNIWAIHRHPREFPDPDDFRPERFLNGLERPYPNNKGMNPFGWGRRQCSGQPLAEQGLLYSLTRLIWAFDISPGLDNNGNEVKLDIFAYTDSENMRPEPFSARFIPRSDKIRQAIIEEAELAREELRVYDGETKLTLEDAVQALSLRKKSTKV